MNAKRITALALALVMTLLLAACGSKTVVNDDGTKTEQTERGVKVTQTAAKAVQTEKYETADFSMTIPKGWTVTTGGTNIYHSIRVYDPAEPLNQMFVLLKADVLLHSQAGKEAWQQNYSMGNTQAALFTKAAVLDNPSTEGFSKYSHSIRHLHRRWSLLIPDMPSPSSMTSPSLTAIPLPAR